ncbi:MAG: hypothetical protein M1814_000391 [Vezdaea aestivalis]|nr:MAG: hypothetical protein M1814_000391 [Vezdaea aestivalis]
MSSQIAYIQPELQSPFSNGSPNLADKAQQPETPSGMDHSSDDDQQTRGRRRSRDETDDGDVRMTDADAADDKDDGEGRSRKRRRSRKGLDKKFPCRTEGCNKSYSRAEHLHRHELNHNPKRQYFCGWVGCDRHFVRQDLCTRHQERHTARGSQLQKKEAALQNAAAAATTADAKAIKRETDSDSIVTHPIGSTQPSLSKESPYVDQNSRSHPAVYTSPIDTKYAALSPTSTTSSNTVIGSAGAHQDGQSRLPFPVGESISRSVHRSNSDASDLGHRASWDHGIKSRSMTMSSNDSAPQRSGSMASGGGGGYSASPPHHVNQQFSRPSLRTTSSANHGIPGSHQGYYTTNSIPGTHGMSNHHHSDSNSSGLYNIPSGQGSYASPQNFVSAPPLSLPPPGFSTMSPSVPARNPNASLLHGDNMTTAGIDEALAASVESVGMTDTIYMPVFGGEGLNRSPYVLPEDFAAWLGLLHENPSFSSPVGHVSSAAGGFNNYMDSLNFGYPYEDPFHQQPMPPQHPMSVASMLDTNPPESVLSENKRADLLETIDPFLLHRDGPIKPAKKAVLLGGNRNSEDHLLCLKMMQTYIRCFWTHFHPQLPILHKPTFAADKCERLLLLVIMTIGASCLDKRYSHGLTQDGADLACILAWHVRSEIFNHPDFSPPAKLWVFQALIFLEIYEKMFATRQLHERAHIHRATTVTLMRRGSSLIGRASYESPPSVRDDKHGAGSDSSHHNSGANTPDKWWHNWISAEATRRVAFAAFVMDSTHAAMFGHTAEMLAHEMRLPLPCDEASWSATSVIEVGRIDASLNANGTKPTLFLEGLKKTMSGQAVRTNSFGRTVLMAGLLSVNYHMNQRDLQMSSIGAKSGFGGGLKWRAALTQAFDMWKRDFDSDIHNLGTGSHLHGGNLHDDNVFESRTVMHHLAHMAVHVNIVDCQIFAKAQRLLGRTISHQDYTAATRRMRENWAPSARARDATFYSLRFLTQVLTPSDSASPDYLAREDFLLNRPWVLYYAALVTWCYGFALEGKLNPPQPALLSHEDRVVDMRAFLHHMGDHEGGVQGPHDLQKVSGRNRCVGLLLVIRDMFNETRWELLHEAAKLLENCVEMLVS